MTVNRLPIFGSLSFFAFSVIASAVETPLSLNELYQTGIARSETVSLQRENLVQAQELRTRATSARLPTLEMLATYFRQEESLSALGQSVSPPVQRNWRLTGRQLLFQGGSEFHLLSQTKLGLAAAEQSVNASQQTFYLEVASLYFPLLLKQREIFHAKNQAKLFADQVNELRGRVRIGRNRASEQLTVEAAAAQITANLRTLEAEEFTLQTQLRSLVGVNELALREEIPFQREPLASLEDYLNWTKNSPALRAALLTREAAEEGVGVAKGGHLPTVGVAGNYYFHREGGVNSSINWDVLATVTVPIFAGGATQSVIREAASRNRQAEVEAGRTLRTTENDVISLHRTLSTSEAELKALQDARDLAKRSYDRIGRDFRFGLTNNLELIQSMRTLQETEIAFDRARITRLQNRVQLEVVAGRLPSPT